MAEIFCTGLNLGNPATWGKCLIDTAFFGDPLLAGIIFYAGIGIFIYANKLPGKLALPAGMLISAGMYLSSPMQLYFVLFTLAVVLNFAYAGFVLLKRWFH